MSNTNVKLKLIFIMEQNNQNAEICNTVNLVFKTPNELILDIP